jgi:NADPH2:quinone reductase
MTAVVRFHRHGPPSVLQLEDEQIGALGAGQVRLRHEAIGVNFIDTAFRSGTFPMPVPAVAGVQGAGIVETVGPGVVTVSPGDRVGYLFAPGSYAQLRLIDADVLVRLPDDISSETAAAIMTKGLTAWMAVHGLHELRSGETVLIQGATSGVGSLLAHWARAIGATVIGTGAAAKLAGISGTVDHALASDDPELAAKIRAIVPNGVDVVYEFIGRATFEASIAAVRDGGAILTIGAASGPPDIDQARLASRRVRVAGGSAAQSVTGALLARASTELFGLVRRGVFGRIEIARYPLAEAARAHQDIADRRREGFPILLP